MTFSGDRELIQLISKAMKNIILSLLITAALICSSCSTAAYLPTNSRIVDNQYGSYINIQMNYMSSIDGELIAVTPKIVYVLIYKDGTTHLDSANLDQIKDFSLRYAKSNAAYYGLMIPASAAITLSHGWFLLFTLPLNLITTTVVTLTAGSSFVIKMKDISWDNLYKFARFPQGIPDNVRLNDIK